MAFAYPAYALFLIYPLVWLDFPTAQAIWMSANLMLVILLPFLLLPRTPPITIITFLLFYPLTFGVLLGNFNIPTAIAIFTFLACFVIRKQRGVPLQILAGLLLAWTLVKPQLSWLFLIFALLFILRERLWILLASLTSCSAAMLGLSFAIFPVDWPFQWLSRARAYTGYVQAEPVIQSFLKVFLPWNPAQLTSLLFIVLLGIITLLNFYQLVGSRQPKNAHSCISRKIRSEGSVYTGERSTIIDLDRVSHLPGAPIAYFLRAIIHHDPIFPLDGDALAAGE